VSSPAQRDQHWAPTLKRSVALFNAFRFEQSEPSRFYGSLADDSVLQLGHYVPLAGKRVLDVGGGPGYFATAFENAGATYVALDSDVGEMTGLQALRENSVVGSGMQLPFADESVDVCYSSNVLEHVPRPWQMAEEMVRVTKKGGLVFLSFTVWYGPWGGHETSPWHYLGGARARRRYARKQGHQPKNKYGESLFAVTVRDALTWTMTQREVEVVEVFPRYHPRWSWWILRVPGLRELLTWNLAIVLRRP
jgi:SAM-dependent methyltransferase